MPKNLTKSLFFFTFALATPVLADFTQADSEKAIASCQGGSFIGAEGFGKKPEEAIAKTQAKIAGKIISLVESKVKMFDISGKGEDGVLKEFSSYSDSSKIESKDVPIVGFKEIEPPKQQEDGEFMLKGFVCRSTEARVWLDDSLDASVTDYSRSASEISATENSARKNELLFAAASVRKRANRAALIFSSITEGDMSAEMSKKYSKLQKDFKDAENKIEIAEKEKFDNKYGLRDKPILILYSLIPPGGWAQLYKGNYGWTAAIWIWEAGWLTAGGISVLNYKDANRKYKDAVLKANSSTNLNEKNELLQKSKGYKSDRESAENIALVGFGFAGAGYVFSVLHGLSADADTERKYIPHAAILPIPSQNGIGTAFVLTGSF